MTKASSRARSSAGRRCWERWRASSRGCEAGLALPQEVLLPDLDPVVAEDVVRRRAVEEDVGEHVGEEVRLALHRLLRRARLPRDGALLRAVDLRGLQGLQ